MQIYQETRGTRAPIVWSDLHHDIVGDARGHIKKVVNLEAVLTSLDNILRTSPFQRVMRPTFASGIGHYVFEPMTPAVIRSAIHEVQRAINNWDDRIIIYSVSFEANPDNNSLGISISGSVRGYDDVFEYETVVSAGE
jgi:hypothetical protein